MDAWIWALIVIVAISSWRTVGMLALRNFYFVFGQSLNRDELNLAWLGYLLLVLTIFIAIVKTVIITFMVFIHSIVDFFVGIATGGVPEWLDRQEETARRFFNGFEEYK